MNQKELRKQRPKQNTDASHLFQVLFSNMKPVSNSFFAL